MDIKYLPIEQVEQAMWEDNPRTITPAELIKVRTSIREFGFVLPVIINRTTGRVVGGHQRIKAAILEGFTSLPTIYVEIESGSELLLNLSLNKISGDWDYGLLSDMLCNLADTPELELSGFDDADILAIFGSDQSRQAIIQETVASSQLEMEAFIKQADRSTALNYVDFRSPSVIFRCLNNDYLDFVDRLKTRIGLSDNDCKAEFMKMIGLVNN